MVSRRVTGQTVVAVLIVLVGLVLLGRTTGIYDASMIFRYVPSLFVLAGLYALVVSNFRNAVGSQCHQPGVSLTRFIFHRAPGIQCR